MSTTSVKPLELVVSAIHCLRETKGSSPQNILKYLSGKYNADTEMLKVHIQTGLKRGVSFGLITNNSGLYRLNEILSAPQIQMETPKSRSFLKSTKPAQKRRQSKFVKRRGKQRYFKSSASSKRNVRKRKHKRKKRGGSSRRLLNEVKVRKSKQHKAKGKRVQKAKSKKNKKVYLKSSQLNPDIPELEQPLAVREPDVIKNII